MTTACHTFFAVLELVAHLASFLPKRDLIQFTQINRTINSICNPSFWREVNFSNYSVYRRLLNTPEALKAFGDNINSVQSVQWEFTFSWYYMNALWTYLTTSPSAAHQHIPTNAFLNSSWSQLTAPIDPSPILLPPMLRLTHYTSVYTTVNHISEPSFSAEYILHRQEFHQHQLLWFLRLNSATLTHLQLTHVPFLSPSFIRNICRTISRLDHLKILRLTSPSPPKKFTSNVVEALFFSCPGSLIEFTIGPLVNYLRKAMDLTPKERGWDFDQGHLVSRQGPLPLLKTLMVPAMNNMLSGYPFSTSRSFLQHCPALEKLTLPSVRDSIVAQAIAKVIRDHCPAITDLTIPIGTDPPHYRNNDTALVIVEHMRGQRLVRFHISSLSDESTRTLSSTAFLRHSDTLRQIQFSECHKLKSSTLQAVLISCRALESFKVSKATTRTRSSLSLEDAIAKEWACTRIQKLAITVSLTPDGRDPEYLADPTMGTWTEQDHQHCKMLDNFYTQIGLLRELTFLKFEAAGTDSVDDQAATDVPYTKTCLPGLLALEDSATSQIGYLSRWSGLTRLRELRGSFSVTAKEVAARMGEHEVDWFATHLPALRRVSLLPVLYSEAFSDDVPKIIEDIGQRRPELDLFDFL